MVLRVMKLNYSSVHKKRDNLENSIVGEEAILGHEYWGIVYPNSKYKIYISLDTRSLIVTFLLTLLYNILTENAIILLPF